MAWNIFLSALESPKSANVASVLNPVPLKFRDLVYGDNVGGVFIYIVDGFGNLDARSGSGNYTLKTSIGLAGQSPISQSSAWTLALTATGAGWQGSIETDQAGFTSLFSSTGMNPLELVFEVKIYNPQNQATTLAQIPISLFNAEVSGTTPNPDVLVNAIRGTFNLVQGADSGTVSGLALVSSPTAVLLHPIRKPANGLNIFASPVNGSLTQDGFLFTLDGQPDSGGYWLDYVITFN